MAEPSMAEQHPHYYVGVDIGTGSARAGVVSSEGRVHVSAISPITVFNPKPNHYEQSSTQIWDAICIAVKEAIKKSGVNKEDIVGIGFDATCSLVILDELYQPISINEEGINERNVILWMDHRAVQEANDINDTKHQVLDYVGGVISPEMETPKMLWLKRHLPESFNRAAHFFDLADFCSFRATDKKARSVCTVTCKWTYLSHSEANTKWSEDLFHLIGLEELTSNNFERIGTSTDIKMLGECVGTVSERAAKELGLSSSTCVAVSIIDAHAGAIGCLGADLSHIGFSAEEEKSTASLTNRIAIIAGTSSCHMSVCPSPTFVPGVWGPYYSALIPNLWLLEGGQSTAGAALDHIVSMHPFGNEATRAAKEIDISLYDFLNKEVMSMSMTAQQMEEEEAAENVSFLTKERHVLPYFHGNRSPRADPTLSGILSGISLRDDLQDLAILYLSTLQSIAYGDKHIIQCMEQQGVGPITVIFVCGGLSKNSLYLQELANITNCIVALSHEADTVLLGAALLSACAFNRNNVITSSIPNMMRAMNKVNPDLIYRPMKNVMTFHDKKFRVFLKMYDDFISYRDIMNEEQH